MAPRAAVPSLGEGFDLGVRTTGGLGRALADDDAVAVEDAADPRVGRRVPASSGGQRERPTHQLGVRVHAVSSSLVGWPRLADLM